MRLSFRGLPLLVLASLLLGSCTEGTSSDPDPAANVASVEVTPGTVALAVGTSQQLTATAKSGTGATISGKTATWSSSNTAIATVSATGLVTGVSVGGPVTITATIDAASKAVPVTVIPKPVNGVLVTPGQVSTVVGAAVQFSATPLDSDGQPLIGRPIAWQSSNTAVATVTPTGSAVAVAPGTASIIATSEGVSGTAVMTVSARPASRLGFTTQPGNGTAGQVLGPVRVAIQDELGGTITSATNTVTLSLADNPGTGSLAGTLSANAVQGVATFTDLLLNTAASGYTLRASSLGLSPALSTPFAVSAASAASLAMATQPSGTAVSGLTLAQQPVVQLRDQFGNAVAQAGTVVSVSLVGNGATLSGTTTATTTASGTASFTGLTITGTAGSFSLQFTATGLAGVASSSITLTAASASRLGLATTPSGIAQSGVPLLQQPVIQVVDAVGNPVARSGVAVTVTLGGTGGTLAGTATVSTGPEGRAAFSGLTITGPTGTYTLIFTATGYEGATSAPITLNAGPAAGIQVTTQPSASAISGVALGTQPVLQVIDGAGNPVAQSGVTITARNSGGATVSSGASATTNAGGVATFAGLTLTGPAGSYSLTFDAPGLGSAGSTPIQLSAGNPTALVMVRQPSNSALTGVAFAVQPQIGIVDEGGNPRSISGTVVTAALASGTGTLGGTLTATTDGSGTATFANLSITGAAGTFTIRFSAPSLTAVVSRTIGLGGATATAITANSTTSQTATVGAAVGAPPSVLVTDANGLPVVGRTVTFAVVSGGGSISPASPASVTTNASGVATLTSWTLGGTAGTNTVTATATGLTGSPVTFTATGTAGTATTIAANSATTQTATAGTAVSAPPSVIVRDANGNPVSGRSVTFAVASGGGSVTPASVTTNVSGIATVTSWTLGGTSGTNTVTATATGLTGSPVTFTATGTAGAAGSIAANSATTQSATAGTAVAAAPSVIVRDGNSNPVSGVVVTFAVASGGGSISPASPASVTTNASGVATLTSWTLGTTAGTNTVTATATGLTGSPVTFTATGTAGAATQVAASSATTQSAAAGTAVSAPPSVVVRDANGNPVSGRSVTFAVASGGGSVTPASVTTNASGVATVTSWTLGTTAGTNTVTATATGLTGSPVTFTATGTAGAATQIAANSATTQTATAGTAVSAPPSVVVRDANGNPVSGRSVTFAVASGGGSVTPASVTTNASGIATVTSWTLGGTAGTNTVTATATGLTGSPVTFTATGTAGAATQITANSSTSQSASAGTAVSAPPSVLVRDANGNPVSAVSVTFAVATGGGSINPASPAILTTNASGVATLTSWTLGASVGSNNNTVTATATGLTGSPVTFTASGLGGAATQVVITTQPAGAVSGVNLTTQPVVQLRDGSGNLSPSTAAVTVAIASGTGSLVGTTTVNAVGGVATFTNLRINGPGVHTLVFTSAGLTSATSSSFTVTQVAASLQVQTQPAAVISDSLFATAPVVRILDNAGLLVTTGSGATLTVTASVSSGTGAVAGTTTATAVGGVATFSGLKVRGTGSHVLRFATASPALSVNSSAFTVAGMKLNLTASATATATVNTDLAIPVLIDFSDRNGLDLASVTVTVTWDPTKFTYVSTSAGNWLDNNGDPGTVITNTSATASGTFGITGFSTEATTNNFTIRTITLRPIVAGTNTVTATVSAAGNVGGAAVPVVPRNLSVTANP